MLLTLGETGWSSEGDQISLTQREATFLAYLSDHAPRVVRRESLAHLFWPRSTTPRALRSLSQLHYQIKKRVPNLPWKSDARHIGIYPIPTDFQALRDCAADLSISRGLDLFAGAFLGEPIHWSKELEIWQSGKTGELLDVLDNMLEYSLEQIPQLDDRSRLTRAIDGLMRSGVSTSTLLLARVILYVHDGQLNAARDMYELLAQDFGAPMSWESLIAHTQGSDASDQYDDEDVLPFVGRKEELDVLRSHLRKAQQGKGGVVVLRGEPGIGKTRLARHLLRFAAISGSRVWEVHAHYATRRIRFSTLSNLLKDNWKGWSNPGQNVAWVDHISGRTQAGVSTPAHPRLSLLESAASIIEEHARESPLIIFVDDAQWVDDFTAQLLLFMAVRAPRQKLLLLLALRTAEPDATPDWLAHELPNVTHIDVGQLNVESAAELVRAFEVRRDVQLRDVERNQVLWHTAGRPLLLVEMLNAISGDSKYQIGGSGIMLPESTEALLRRRFTGLGHSAVWVYGIVAAVGEPVDIADLIQLAAIDHRQAAESLEVLSDRTILEVRDGYVTFPHDMLREVAYRSLGSSTRVLIHRRISDYTEETSGDVGVLAYHLAAAGAGSQAAKHAMIAAQHAGQDGRFGDREFYYRLAVDNADDALRVDAAIALARHLIEAQRVTEVTALIPLLHAESSGREGQLLAELALLGEQVVHGTLRPEQVVTAASSVTDILSQIEASELAPAIETIIDVILDAPDSAAGDNIVGAISTLTRSTNDATLIYHARCMALLWECVTKGYNAPLDSVTQCHDEPSSYGRRAGFGFFARGTIFMVAGRLDAARIDLERALALANDHGDQVRASAAAANLGVVLTEMGDLTAAKKFLEANLTSHNFTHRLRGHANLAILAYESGDYESAVSTADNLLRANQPYGAAKYRNTANAVIGLSELQLGNTRGAAEKLSQVLDRDSMTLASTGDLGYIASFASKGLAVLHNDVQASSEILTRFTNAVEGRDAIAYLRLLLAQAELLAISGSPEAYPHAKKVFRMAESLGATVLRDRAEDLMKSTRA